MPRKTSKQIKKLATDILDEYNTAKRRFFAFPESEQMPLFTSITGGKQEVADLFVELSDGSFTTKFIDNEVGFLQRNSTYKYLERVRAWCNVYEQKVKEAGAAKEADTKKAKEAEEAEQRQRGRRQKRGNRPGGHSLAHPVRHRQQHHLATLAEYNNIGPGILSLRAQTRNDGSWRRIEAEVTREETTLSHY